VPPGQLPPTIMLFTPSHTRYEIHFGISRCGTYRRSCGTAVENLCDTLSLLQHSAAKVRCNVTVAAV